MPAYARQRTFANLTAFAEADLEAELNALVTAVSGVDATQVRTGARFDIDKFDHSRTHCIASAYRPIHHGSEFGENAGQEYPLVITTPTNPAFSNGNTRGIRGDGTAALPIHRSDGPAEALNLIQPVLVVPMSEYTAAGQRSPRMALRAVSVTATIIYNDATIQAGAVVGGTNNYDTKQDVADAMILRVYRAPATALRRRDMVTQSAGAVIPMYFLDAEKEATLLAEQVGLRARETAPAGGERSRTGPNNFITAAQIWTDLADSGVSADATWQAAQVMGLVGPAQIPEPMPLSADDVLIVALTAQELLLFAGNATLQLSQRNCIFPVRGYMATAVLESELA